MSFTVDTPIHLNDLLTRYSTLNRIILQPARYWLPQVRYVPKKGKATAQAAPESPYPEIKFDYAGHANEGIFMKDINPGLDDALRTRLEGCDDLVFENRGLQRITLKIIWPRYEYLDFSRTIELETSSGPITRWKLGAVISANYSRFLISAQGSPPSDSGTPYAIGRPGIRTQHLVLYSLINVWHNTWQAVVAIQHPLHD
ncbi:hypothetical protein BDN72DRAFT_883590 [Pluteus cervinus]|uniref:Uncharacterized protein n=1 Tax=Pluteus cervinus TaxID=181527 RepID=A0ACD3A4K4_9AGAR|nr:hypothetical protein BDN72DRAFT_883590 [Pluteus cervinus]